MTVSVTDARSNRNEQIDHAVRVINKSKDRLKVFLAIHAGKKKAKTASDIARMTRLKRKRVLEEGVKLINAQIVGRSDSPGEIAYVRDAFLYANRSQIVALIKDPKKLERFPTKRSPKRTGPFTTIRVPSRSVRIRSVTVEDIDSFKRVKGIKGDATAPVLSESRFKEGVKRIIGETGKFKDWGGEQSDVFTSRVRMNGRRLLTAFAFKGPGKKGTLTPGGMGKNGDQIQRMFKEPAQVFLVQYHGQVAASVLQTMVTHAQSKSYNTGERIYYGVIDGQDTRRLIAAYRLAFRLKKPTR